ncbi:MAG: DUF962 domain-containing protein [Vicinamibacteria bacterium]
MIRKELTSFEAFWPHYLGEHRHPVNRVLHFIGTTLVYAILALSLLRSPGWLALAPLVGYGFAWVGHFFVERNRPATFTYPLWSLRGDFRMHARTLTGRLREDLEALRLAPCGLAADRA